MRWLPPLLSFALLPVALLAVLAMSGCGVPWAQPTGAFVGAEVASVTIFGRGMGDLAYSAITGYNPADPSTDQGAVELDVLNYWRQNGIAGHKILGYAKLDPGNVDHVRQSVYLFEGTYIGVQLPISAQGQATWDVPAGGLTGDGEPGSWGGHAVPVIGYDADGLWVVTWGKLLKMTWAFWRAYTDEAYACFSIDMLEAGKSPAGFDLPALQTFLAGVGTMKYSRFLSYNIVGGILWGAGVVSLGYFLGSIIPNSDKFILPLTLR